MIRIVVSRGHIIVEFTVFTVYTINIKMNRRRLMATKLLNIKMDESDIAEIKKVAGIYNITVTDLIKNAVTDYLVDLRNDPYYRLTVSVEEASDDEQKEILEEVRSLSPDDLSISSRKRLTVKD